ncbi:uncharacterized protein MYCFIDRAFT_147649, partial [Pseudocercospora fijiensis CIRAD86]
GIIVDKAVLDISRKDFILGLTYVGTSRVRGPRDIIFKATFNFYNRFKSGKVPGIVVSRYANLVRRRL